MNSLSISKPKNFEPSDGVSTEGVSMPPAQTPAAFTVRYPCLIAAINSRDTSEISVASGYGSVMVLVNGLEPLPIRLQGDRSTIGAKPAYLAGQRGLEPR